MPTIHWQLAMKLKQLQKNAWTDTGTTGRQGRSVARLCRAIGDRDARSPDQHIGEVGEGAEGDGGGGGGTITQKEG